MLKCTMAVSHGCNSHTYRPRSRDMTTVAQTICIAYMQELGKGSPTGGPTWVEAH